METERLSVEIDCLFNEVGLDQLFQAIEFFGPPGHVFLELFLAFQSARRSWRKVPDKDHFFVA